MRGFDSCYPCIILKRYTNPTKQSIFFFVKKKSPLKTKTTHYYTRKTTALPCFTFRAIHFSDLTFQLVKTLPTYLIYTYIRYYNQYILVKPSTLILNNIHLTNTKLNPHLINQVYNTKLNFRYL